MCEKCDKIGGIEELKVFFEVLVVRGMKKYLSVEALEAHLLERDWGARQVLRKALPLFPTSARKQDGSVHTESRVSPSEEVIRHVLADELAVEKELDY